jgi:hypothetical protein
LARRIAPHHSCSAKNMPNERARQDRVAGVGGLFSAHQNPGLPMGRAMRAMAALIDWK